MKTYDQLTDLFERANESFLQSEQDLLHSGVNERTVCGALMLHLHDLIKDDASYDGYFTDVEYNRNRGAIKTVAKTVCGTELKVIRINCDIILHSRGKHPEQDNLIAIEMKKTFRRFCDKESDRVRLKALTADSFDDIWSFDGHTLPEHVCRYVLGVYYEINAHRNEIAIEYYHHGELVERYNINLLSKERKEDSKAKVYR